MKDTINDDIITEDERQSIYFLFSEIKDYTECSPSWMNEEHSEITLKKDAPQYIRDCFDEYIKLTKYIQSKLEEYDRKHGYIRPIR